MEKGETRDRKKNLKGFRVPINHVYKLEHLKKYYTHSTQSLLFSEMNFNFFTNYSSSYFLDGGSGGVHLPCLQRGGLASVL